MFHQILIRPLLNLLIWLYNVIPGHDLGLALIAFTILVRLALFPSFQKSLRSQRQLQQIQPKLDEIRTKYENDKEAQTKAMLEFYQQHKINPLSSCLPLLIQLPLLIALYSVFRIGLNGNLASDLYPFVANPGIINHNLLGIVELAKPNIILGVFAGLTQFVQSKMMAPKTTSASDKTTTLMNAQFTYLMPAVTVLIATKLPAGLSLYWVITTLFAISQQYYIIKKRNDR